MSTLVVPGTALYRIVRKADLRPKWKSTNGFPSEDWPVVDASEANVVTSGLGGDLHAPALDLDVPAVLIPSSTEGHSHLYIDVPMSWRKYKRLLKALGKAGILEPGYVKASIARRATYLRLPWVKKEEK